MNKGSKEFISNILSIIFALALCASIFGLIYFYDYSDSLEQEIKMRDNTIEIMNQRDSVLQSALNSKYKVDSLVMKKDNVITSAELVQYANELVKENIGLYNKINGLNDSIRYYKIYYDYSQSAFNHKYIVKENASKGRTYSFESNAVTKDNYKKCQEQTRKLIDEINDAKTKQFKAERELSNYKHIMSWYKIDPNRNTQNDAILYPGFGYSPRLDSALMLLPVYGDKLKYNSSKQEWSVGGKMTIKIERSVGEPVGDTIRIKY